MQRLFVKSCSKNRCREDNQRFLAEIRSIVLGLILGTTFGLMGMFSREVNRPTNKVVIMPIIEPIEEEYIATRCLYVEAENEPIIEPIEVVEPDVVEEKVYDELEYLACCVEAEAGNQGMLGKRLVCDVILNRVDSADFPNTITEVINQDGQFSVVSNGSINRVSVSDETFNACKLELIERTDSEILYFTARQYNPSGTPAYQHQDHYFSY